jgi:acyl-CoA-dependent ceramide synthase
MTRYLSVKQIITDSLFGLFMISWLVTRHVLFLFVIWSTVVDGSRLIDFRWDPEGGHYVTLKMYYGFSGMLLSLQVSWQPFTSRTLTLTRLLTGITADVVLVDLQNCMASR